MALSVETGSGLSDANAYVSVAEVDTYAAARNITAWATASTAQKEAAIIEATFYLDSKFIFLGAQTSAAQALSWPRAGAADIYGGQAIPSNALPISLKRACMELAIKSQGGTTLMEDLAHGGDVTSEAVGPLKVTYKDGASNTTLYMVTGLIKGLIRPEDPNYAPAISGPTYQSEQYFSGGQFNNTGDGASPGGS